MPEIQLVLALAVALLVGRTTAFLVPSRIATAEHRRASWRQPHHRPFLGATSSSSSVDHGPASTAEMRQDIDSLREEARRRLAAVSQQMEELKHQAEEHERCNHEDRAAAAAAPSAHAATATARAPEPAAPPAATGAPSSSSSTGAAARKDPHSLDSLEGDWAAAADNQPPTTPDTAPVVTSPTLPPVPPAPAPSPRPERVVVDTGLLAGTRWKVAFNIGREAGTWMPPDWGRSGERLLFQVVVDLTDRQLYEGEDFFQGVAGARLLEVREGWVLPVGVGRDSHGRQPIKVKPIGGYKVLPGSGPLGTHIVRFFIELEEDVQPTPGSDVFCPKGRVYATCGYFPMHKKEVGVASPKEVAEDAYRATVARYERLQREIDADERLFSLERLKLMKEQFDVKREVGRTARALQEARQRDPEKSQLRLTRDGRVGLTKEGGVCCKVQKGVALEYHILGRIELACVDKHEAHDEYQELVHQLHP